MLKEPHKSLVVKFDEVEGGKGPMPARVGA